MVTSLPSYSSLFTPRLHTSSARPQVAESLAGLGFAREDMQWLFFLVAGVLHLGDVAFASAEGGEGSAVEPASHGSLSLAAHYLGAPEHSIA